MLIRHITNAKVHWTSSLILVFTPRAMITSRKYYCGPPIEGSHDSLCCCFYLDFINGHSHGHGGHITKWDQGITQTSGLRRFKPFYYQKKSSAHYFQDSLKWICLTFFRKGIFTERRTSIDSVIMLWSLLLHASCKEGEFMTNVRSYCFCKFSANFVLMIVFSAGAGLCSEASLWQLEAKK